jgi:hypothetical protein
MSILSLHPNQLRIMSALQSATRILGMTDHLTIVGGFGRFLAGQTKRVGDVDVLIGKPICERYWDSRRGSPPGSGVADGINR